MSYDCDAPPADLAACSTADDCTTVAVGCYCGAQPVNGVVRRFAVTAQACEDAAASTCALGCLVVPELQAQDGQRVANGSTIAVQCERPAGAAGSCRTYVP
jgi:hypothetical protein